MTKPQSFARNLPEMVLQGLLYAFSTGIISGSLILYSSFWFDYHSWRFICTIAMVLWICWSLSVMFVMLMYFYELGRAIENVLRKE